MLGARGGGRETQGSGAELARRALGWALGEECRVKLSPLSLRGEEAGMGHHLCSENRQSQQQAIGSNRSPLTPVGRAEAGTYGSEEGQEPRPPGPWGEA